MKEQPVVTVFPPPASVLLPATAAQLAELLAGASADERTVNICGNNSKQLAAGPILPANCHISTAGLNRILQHERNDLTISVEAGMRWSALQQHLREHGQRIALDPPWAAEATVGGVLAADSNGPLRKRYGTARDQVIGLTLATIDGRLIPVGGMVVKNVAGLDITKLLIGSFGTLAVITSVNFRVHTLPSASRTWLLSAREPEGVIEQRNRLLNSPLRPDALEMFSPPVAARVGRRGFLLAVRAAGSPAVLDRYTRELAAGEVLNGAEDEAFWQLTSGFTSDFLQRNPAGIVLRVATTLSDLLPLFKSGAGSYLSHAASGITYAYCSGWPGLQPLWNMAHERGWPIRQ